jgi:N-acylglucosamine-6-phosphate 2-epimerase
MHPAFEQLRRGLIVSCQAEGDDPFNTPSHVALFARAAEMGGAAGIRAREADNIAAIRSAVALPIIGITKSEYEDGSVLITPDFRAVEAVLNAGADIVAADGTDRVRPGGMSGPEFIRRFKSCFSAPLMADISTLDEALGALDAGADAVATTLSGHTPRTAGRVLREPDWELLDALVKAADVPVIVEGSVWTPEQAGRAIDAGAFAVVVGTAITRPRVVTQVFVDRMRVAR